MRDGACLFAPRPPPQLPSVILKSQGTDPNEAEILLYGGEMEHASAPLFVSGWHLGSDLKMESELGEDDYLPIKVNIACSDGKVGALSKAGQSRVLLIV